MNIISKNKSLVFTLLMFFMLCAGYYFGNDLGDFPDENQHLGYVLDVTKHGFPDYAHGMIYGEKKLNHLEHPALYYVISGEVGKIASLFDITLIKSLRIVNIFISSLTLLTIYCSLKALKVSQMAIFMSLLFIISIPMFILLSSSISNDPLMILGGALTFHALVLYYKNESARKTLYFFIAGGLIVALTKATGALSVLCVILVFLLLENKSIINKIKDLKKYDFIAVVMALSFIVLYYIVIHIIYGGFFPAPQGDPSDWFEQANPDAPRFSLVENIIAFYQSNMHTLLIPYGHKPFSDLHFREVLLGYSFGVIPIFILLNIYTGLKTNTLKWKISFITIISFIIYTLFYFYTVRQLNLKTGYPGAMQARYLFVFLPAIVIIYAATYQSIKSFLIRNILSLIVISTSLLSFYPSYYSLVSPIVTPFYGQIKSDSFFGELIKGRTFEQQFISQYDTLNKVDLYLATYARSNTSNVSLEIVNKAGKIIGTSTVNASQLIDNSWATFTFKSLQLSKGETYTLRLISDDASNGNAITWYAYSGRNAFPMYAGTVYGPGEPKVNRYLSGHALVDGNVIDAAFSFKIYVN